MKVCGCRPLPPPSPTTPCRLDRWSIVRICSCPSRRAWGRSSTRRVFRGSCERDCGRGDLPQGRDQPGDLLQLEKVRRIVADRDAAVEAARGERQIEELMVEPVARQGDPAGRWSCVNYLDNSIWTCNPRSSFQVDLRCCFYRLDGVAI